MDVAEALSESQQDEYEQLVDLLHADDDDDQQRRIAEQIREHRAEPNRLEVVSNALLNDALSPQVGGDDGRIANLMSMFPNAGVEQLTTALQRTGDDMQRAVDWLMATEAPQRAVSSDSDDGGAMAAAPDDGDSSDSADARPAAWHAPDSPGHVVPPPFNVPPAAGQARRGRGHGAKGIGAKRGRGKSSVPLVAEAVAADVDSADSDLFDAPAAAAAATPPQTVRGAKRGRHVKLTAADREKAELLRLIRQFQAEGEGEPRVADLVRRLLDRTIEPDEFVETLPPHIGVGQLPKFDALARRFLDELRDDVDSGDVVVDIPQLRRPKRRAVGSPGVTKKQAAVAVADADQSSSTAASSAEPQRPSSPLIHAPDQIIECINAILTKQPGADANVLYNRLEHAPDLDEAARRLIDELSAPAAAAVADDAPGPSRLSSSPQLDASTSEFLSDEGRADLKTICQMFPEADPYFVVEQLVQHQLSCADVVNKMTNSSYPKYKARLEKARLERRRADFLNTDSFNVSEFLLLFDDPENYFATAERIVTALYKEHARAFLLNRYPNIRPEYIDACLEESSGRLLPTIRVIENPTEGRRRAARGRGRTAAARSPAGSPRRKRKPARHVAPGQDRTADLEWPAQLDEQFFREVQFVMNEDKISAFILQREQSRAARMVEARENEELQECQCCFVDDVLPEEMVTCDNAAELHRFCRACVREHAETQIGDGQHRIGCVADGCKEHYAVESLRTLIRPANYLQLLRRCQQHELRVAEIDNMESCPFCDFAMIIEGDDDRVFRCRNPDCLKESCRQCKEESHLPLKCDEVEKDAETRMRTFVENRMAEAMIRVCPKCGKRIIKSDGCNKMACPCGAFICYVCRELLPRQNPYGHFDGGPHGPIPVRGADGVVRMQPAPNATPSQKRCPLNTTMEAVHADEAERAGREAREKFLQDSGAADREQIRKEVNVTELVDRNAAAAAAVPGGHVRFAIPVAMGMAAAPMMMARPGAYGMHGVMGPRDLDVYMPHIGPVARYFDNDPRIGQQAARNRAAMLQQEMMLQEQERRNREQREQQIFLLQERERRNQELREQQQFFDFERERERRVAARWEERVGGARGRLRRLQTAAQGGRFIYRNQLEVLQAQLAEITEYSGEQCAAGNLADQALQRVLVEADRLELQFAAKRLIDVSPDTPESPEEPVSREAAGVATSSGTQDRELDRLLQRAVQLNRLLQRAVGSDEGKRKKSKPMKVVTAENWDADEREATGAEVPSAAAAATADAVVSDRVRHLEGQLSRISGLCATNPRRAAVKPVQADAAASSSRGLDVDAEAKVKQAPPVIGDANSSALERMSSIESNSDESRRSDRIARLRRNRQKVDDTIMRLNDELAAPTARSQASIEKLIDELDKAVASRWQVQDQLSELGDEADGEQQQPAAAADAAAVPDAGAAAGEASTAAGASGGSSPNATPPQPDVRIAAQYRERVDRLNGELRQAQMALVKMAPDAGRAGLATVQRLLRERDHALRACQEIEAVLLRQGTADEELPGRERDKQLRLSHDEIGGAAHEARQLAGRAEAAREAERRAHIAQPPPPPAAVHPIGMPVRGVAGFFPSYGYQAVHRPFLRPVFNQPAPPRPMVAPLPPVAPPPRQPPFQWPTQLNQIIDGVLVLRRRFDRGDVLVTPAVANQMENWLLRAEANGFVIADLWLLIGEIRQFVEREGPATDDLINSWRLFDDQLQRRHAQPQQAPEPSRPARVMSLRRRTQEVFDQRRVEAEMARVLGEMPLRPRSPLTFDGEATAQQAAMPDVGEATSRHREDVQRATADVEKSTRELAQVDAALARTERERRRLDDSAADLRRRRDIIEAQLARKRDQLTEATRRLDGNGGSASPLDDNSGTLTDRLTAVIAETRNEDRRAGEPSQGAARAKCKMRDSSSQTVPELVVLSSDGEDDDPAGIQVLFANVQRDEPRRPSSDSAASDTPAEHSQAPAAWQADQPKSDARDTPSPGADGGGAAVYSPHSPPSPPVQWQQSTWSARPTSFESADQPGDPRVRPGIGRGLALRNAERAYHRRPSPTLDLDNGGAKVEPDTNRLAAPTGGCGGLFESSPLAGRVASLNLPTLAATADDRRGGRQSEGGSGRGGGQRARETVYDQLRRSFEGGAEPPPQQPSPGVIQINIHLGQNAAGAFAAAAAGAEVAEPAEQPMRFEEVNMEEM